MNLYNVTYETSNGLGGVAETEIKLVAQNWKGASEFMDREFWESHVIKMELLSDKIVIAPNTEI